jgi:hypothetical protein
MLEKLHTMWLKKIVIDITLMQGREWQERNGTKTLYAVILISPLENQNPPHWLEVKDLIEKTCSDSLIS